MPVLLLYHRIAATTTDPWALGVSPENFDAHLGVLRRRWRPCALSQLVNGMSIGRSVRNAVAVTFDDGYASCLSEALPRLENLGIPATFFLSTGWLGAKSEWWWDELERLILWSDSLPPISSIECDGQIVRLDLDRTSGSRFTDTEWRAWHPAATERARLYVDFWRLCRTLRDDARSRLLTLLRDWAGVSTTVRSTHRVLTWDEAALLSRSPLVEIGAHTVTHPWLADLDRAAQEVEIMGARRTLEEELHVTVSSFAYPYGGRNDYTMETMSLVRQAGYVCACSNFDGLITGDSDLFQMPRVFVRNVDGPTLERQLEALCV